MTKEKRKEIKETFKALEEVLLQTDSVESIITTPKFIELVAKAKLFSCELWQEMFVIPQGNDFRVDIDNAIEVMGTCQPSVKGGKKCDEWLNVARERLRIVNDCLKDW